MDDVDDLIDDFSILSMESVLTKFIYLFILSSNRTQPSGALIIEL